MACNVVSLAVPLVRIAPRQSEDHAIGRVAHSDKKHQLAFEINLIEGGKSVELFYASLGKLLVKESGVHGAGRGATQRRG